MLDSHTRGGFLRRWRRNALGAAVCTFDAVDPARLSQESRDAILAANQALAAEEEAVVALEAARRLAAGDPPERYEDYTDDAGEARKRETAAYKAYRAAERLVLEASPEIVALADLRAGVYPLDESGAAIVPVDNPGEDPLADLPPFVPVPSEISDRQFFQALAIQGTISTDEALAAVKTGEIPSALAGFLEVLAPAEKFGAEMLLSGATKFERAHPLTDAIGQAQGMSSDQIDDFFRFAAAL